MLVAPLTLALALAPAQMKVELPALGPVIVGRMPALGALALQPGGGFGTGVGFPVPPGSASRSSTLAPVGGPADENVLRNARIERSDSALLDFFRKRTPPAPIRGQIAVLVKRLSGRDPGERDSAQSQLTAIGQAAVPLLRQAMNNVDDAEGSARARQCLQNIEGRGASPLVTHAARLLATRKPDGAARVLIGYLPYAEDDHTFAEVEAALVAVALKNGKPDPALLDAIKDKLALRRGAAAAVLCQAGGPANFAAIQPLLKDSKPSVRLKAALGLVGAYDAEAIPVLIELLAELPPRQRQQADDYLTALAGEWAVTGPRGNDLMARRLRRDVWLAWWKNIDGETLLEEFRSRTLAERDREKIVAAIAQLESTDSDAREAAAKDLLAMGTKATPQLRRVVNDHPGLGPLAARILDTIEKDSPNPMPAAAARLLALRRPAGTVEALVGYLPFVESAEASNALVDILATVGVAGGKAGPALVKALADNSPDRRAGAALALCKGRAMEHLAALRKLLDDKDLIVQLRASQGLAPLGEKQAIPTLIRLLKELPVDRVWEVEDNLSRVAGDRAPTEVITNDAASRTRAVEAWSRWWKDNADKVELARLDLSNRETGFYLIVEGFNPGRARGRVLEVDASGKVRWEIPDLQAPNDAQVLRGGNVLVVEQQRRVTERTRDNKIVWDRAFPNVFHVERLRDGNTFVACRNMLQIVDRTGTPRFTHTYTINPIAAASHLRDGGMAYVSYSGHYVRLDRTGKQVKTMNLNWVGYNINGAEVLPGDRVVVSVANLNKVMEFGPDGKQVWEATVTYPLVPFRLSNGHTILASNSNQAITEIDRKGKIVRQWTGFSFRPLRVIKR